MECSFYTSFVERDTEDRIRMDVKEVNNTSALELASASAHIPDSVRLAFCIQMPLLAPFLRAHMDSNCSCTGCRCALRTLQDG